MANVEPRFFRIGALIEEVRRGKVRPPRFQRPFVWKRSQVLALLDSVRLGFPIGTLLVWKTTDRYASFDHIGPIRLPQDIPQSPVEVSYLLDGHQRVSCLVGALGLREEEACDLSGADRTFLVHYDLKARKFVHGSEDEDHHLPVRFLLPPSGDAEDDRFTAWMDARREKTKIGSPERAAWDTWRRNALQLQTALAQVQVRYDDVTGATLAEAVQIFARVNQEGSHVRPSEVFAALSWRPQGFDFARSASAILERFEPFQSLGTEPLLRALLACLGKGAYERDWPDVLTNHGGELPDTFARVEKGFERALDFLKEELGARSAGVVPYALQVVLLTCFFVWTDRQVPRERLVEWFWASSYGGVYGGSGALSMDIHLDRARRLATGEDLSILDTRPTLSPLPWRFHPRSARVRAWHLHLARLGPLDGMGRTISNPLAAGLQDARPVAAGDAAWLLGARVLLGRSCRDPRKALLGARIGAQIDRVMDSHGIPHSALDALAAGDTETFIRLRFDHLLSKERTFAERFVVVPTVEGDRPEEGENDAELLAIDGVV